MWIQSVCRTGSCPAHGRSGEQEDFGHDICNVLEVQESGDCDNTVYQAGTQVTEALYFLLGFSLELLISRE